MDYGDGYYKGVYQFNSKHRKEDVCAKIEVALTDVCSIDQITAWKAVCGDGIIDPNTETCECVRCFSFFGSNPRLPMLKSCIHVVE
jgi:hypothetical protein